MVRALLFVAVLGGCFDDRYRCTTDAQCNVEGGRCEADGYCTKFDDSCATHRRYQHAGEHGDACFEDALAPVNACAGGQPPATRTGCFARVCERVPACCDMAWTDACVQLAQQMCSELVCDTRIAITAARGLVSELWDLRWDGDSWEEPKKRGEFLPPLAWVAPAPGDREPRLAATTPLGELVVGELTFPIDPARAYASITTIDLDRDRRDTIVVAHNNGANFDHTIDIIKPHSGVIRTASVQGSLGLVWGDLDRDNFADASTRSGAQYFYLPSFDPADHVRSLSSLVAVNAQGGLTPPAPGVRNVDWLELDGDTKLDLVMFGAEVRIHTDPRVIREAAEHRIDCDPPSAQLACGGMPEPNFEAMSFGGAALPNVDRSEILVTTYPDRELYRGYLEGNAMKLERIAFPGDQCQCTRTCMAGECTYDCADCLQILAVIVRDLDGDHALDIVAIDARLNVFYAFAKTNYRFVAGPSLQTALGNPQGFLSISTSVSGAPIL